MPRPQRSTAEEIAARKSLEEAREASRVAWIAANPDAYAAEQEALAASQAERKALEG